MTKTESLQKTVLQWKWMVEDVNRKKCDYPELEEDRPYYNCYLCEYARGLNEGDNRCIHCPMYNRWGRSVTCLGSGSPFVKWENARDNGSLVEAQMYAEQIMVLCQNELKRLEGE